MTLLALESVTKRFGAVAALDALSLEIGAGEFFALLGGSGSGKSTLLRAVAGFELPDAGRVLLRGQDISRQPPPARDVAMMFQSYALFPHLSVADNIAYGLRRAGEGRAAIAARVAELVALLALGGMEARRPRQLSGGQQQRVALARALARRPSLILLDEPLAALDSGLRERTGLELRALQRRLGASFVMVTHDQAEALALADRVAVLEQGRIAQVASPRELYDRPATRSVARFLGAANVLEAGTLPLGAEVAAPAYALRPERIRLVDALPAINGTPATVADLAFRGGDALLLAQVAGGPLLRVVLPAGAALPEAGAAILLAWDAAALAPLAA
ncbi:ABC transporter ATP-binding protein [Roseococcus sp. SYP-B2431]|uniref:ABC transporter ATP-binding protein n=1 Tax=Roseococcus sp. SYP-B2431 TaxID=2496640 RepID=UPI00103CFE22|nr:ABC transporter ATP-binding protein [Roseococcus sp. SYP-B2431]TCH96395.1 ABC transporter ATP-binding protein [Roseococcus sp. SYP-B2431]